MILKGDCIEVMKAMKPNSVDAIVTDPPYGLEFMGKEWDKLWDKRKPGYDNKSYTCSDGSTRKCNPVTWNVANPNYQAGLEAQKWHTQWLTEAYRVLKPGASMLVMGGTRTFHRLACAIEDTGFIIKDTLMWIYGSGFPKAQDLGKMIDKRMGLKQNPITKDYEIRDLFRDKKGKIIQKIKKPPGWFTERYEYNVLNPNTDLAKYWNGFKIGGIKPAYEPIIWAVKPPEGNYVDNVLKWGVGAVNVDACRIEIDIDEAKRSKDFRTSAAAFGAIPLPGRKKPDIRRKVENHHPLSVRHNIKGRFPANVILDEEAGRMLDEQSGEKGNNWRKNKSAKPETLKNQNIFSISGGACHSDSGGASRFFYCAKASRSERNAGLEDTGIKSERPSGILYNEKEQAFSQEKLNKNNHPTVKPIKLFEWLIKLVTRENQVILDPFIGSGTTGISAHNTGRKCMGIEREDDYLTIAKKRMEYWERQPKQIEMREAL